MQKKCEVRKTVNARTEKKMQSSLARDSYTIFRSDGGEGSDGGGSC